MDAQLSAVRIDSPVGELALVSDRFGALVRVGFLATQSVEDVEESIGARGKVTWTEEPEDEVPRQLAEYFARRRRDFELDVAPEGTPFQLQVWRELTRIPYGETISYGELARRIGEPGGSRAVGGANNQNPIAIVIPCHRVVGADGSMVGFGGGLPIKRALLDLERGQQSLFPSAPRPVRRSR